MHPYVIALATLGVIGVVVMALHRLSAGGRPHRIGSSGAQCILLPGNFGMESYARVLFRVLVVGFARLVPNL